MKTELTIEESNILINKGVPVSYASKQNNVEKIDNNVRGLVKKQNPDYIFTQDDLLEIIPKEINIHIGSNEYKSYHLMLEYGKWKDKHEVYSYYASGTSIQGFNISNTLIDCIYNLIIWCIDNKYLTYDVQM